MRHWSKTEIGKALAQGQHTFVKQSLFLLILFFNKWAKIIWQDISQKEVAKKYMKNTWCHQGNWEITTYQWERLWLRRENTSGNRKKNAKIIPARSVDNAVTDRKLQGKGSSKSQTQNHHRSQQVPSWCISKDVEIMMPKTKDSAGQGAFTLYV